MPEPTEAQVALVVRKLPAIRMAVDDGMGLQMVAELLDVPPELVVRVCSDAGISPVKPA
jgi:hypothetical protein